MAGQMANFVYLVGDREKGECVAVDPAWNVRDIVALAAQDGMKLVGVLATHYHPDHIGGDLFGIAVEGLRELMALSPVPIHAHKEESSGIAHDGLSDATWSSTMPEHDDRGGVPITPFTRPATPGSQCFPVGTIVSGDTLFVGGCGRVDLPGSDPDEMYTTLTQRLARLPEETVLYPGHHYGPAPTSTLGRERRTNHYLQVRTLDDWRALMR